MKQPADFLVKNASQLLTMAGPERPRKGEEMEDLGQVEQGAVAAWDGNIVAVGETAEVLEQIELVPYAEVIDAWGKVVMPCMADPHTHLVYGGSREEEFEQRIKGADYLEILEKGGGILSTVKATRDTSFKELVHSGRRRLTHFLRCGVGSLEVKSGYGLNLESEVKQLKAARYIHETSPADMTFTFLGAHAFPPEYRQEKEKYVDLVTETMLPKIAKEGLAQFCDVFCEEKIFSIDQSRRVLEAGKKYNLKPKLHADEIVPFGGAELAAEVGAVSADHLLQISPTGIDRMAEKQVIGVLLPGTAFFLMKNEYAPARDMIEAGVPIALSTDCNPGSSPTEAIHLIMSLACLQMKMTPAEVLTATTINATYAMGVGNLSGSLEKGKQADLLIVTAPNHKYIPYNYGINMVDRVYKRGQKVTL
ncbi:MAG: imidazolonepropionase [Bacillota bacterium]